MGFASSAPAYIYFFFTRYRPLPVCRIIAICSILLPRCAKTCHRDCFFKKLTVALCAANFRLLDSRLRGNDGGGWILGFASSAPAYIYFFFTRYRPLPVCRIIAICSILLPRCAKTCHRDCFFKKLTVALCAANFRLLDSRLRGNDGGGGILGFASSAPTYILKLPKKASYHPCSPKPVAAVKKFNKFPPSLYLN